MCFLCNTTFDIDRKPRRKKVIRPGATSFWDSLGAEPQMAKGSRRQQQERGAERAGAKEAGPKGSEPQGLGTQDPTVKEPGSKEIVLGTQAQLGIFGLGDEESCFKELLSQDLEDEKTSKELGAEENGSMGLGAKGSRPVELGTVEQEQRTQNLGPADLGGAIPGSQGLMRGLVVILCFGLAIAAIRGGKARR